MRAKLIRIGNSKGIRLPKAVIQHCGLEEDVELQVQGNTILVRSFLTHRKGWEQAFRKMAMRGDDQLIDTGDAIQTSWDKKEWRW